MSAFAPSAGLAAASRATLSAAATIFMYTIGIGILNGMDIWEPEHDMLMSHVHSGTLGWITLGVAGIAFLMLSEGREVGADERRSVTNMAWALIGAVVLYILAFAVGDSIFEDRIQRPIFGTVLFVVVIWMLVWIVSAYRKYESPGAARLGLVLAWISLLIGSVFGILLGLYTANGEIPGLDNETAGRFADAHPPAMVIGYLLVAGFAVVEWLLHDGEDGRGGPAQMWLLFVAGIVINIAFVTGTDEQLAGPANLLMIAALVTMLWRSRAMLTPRSLAHRRCRVVPEVRTDVPHRVPRASHGAHLVDHPRRDRLRRLDRVAGRSPAGVRPHDVHRGDDQHHVRRPLRQAAVAPN